MRRAVLVAAAAVAVAAFAAFAATFAAAAAEPRGPVFGNNAYEGEIRDDGGPDADAFVGPLLAGERLSVSVAAARGSPLRPVLALLDPAGEDRTPLLRTAGGGVSFRSFIADVPGRWTVRVAGAGDTEGGYAVRFRVRSRRTAIRRSLPPGPAPPIETNPIPRVRGARRAHRGAGAGARPPAGPRAAHRHPPLPGGGGGAPRPPGRGRGARPPVPRRARSLRSTPSPRPHPPVAAGERVGPRRPPPRSGGRDVEDRRRGGGAGPPRGGPRLPRRASPGPDDPRRRRAPARGAGRSP